MKKALNLMEEESRLKKELKLKAEELHIKTKETIEALTEDEALKMVEYKWIRPLNGSLIDISDSILVTLVNDMRYISDKYAVTMHDIREDGVQTRGTLIDMISTLSGGQSDMEGLEEFRKLLGGQA